MNIDELKDIIRRDGGKIIIVENDKPQLVVMSFDEYRAKMKGQPVQGARGIVENPPAQKNEDPFDQGREGFTIDDLPLS